MKETVSIVTRKGQITLPAEIRRKLGIKEGDKVAIALAPVREGEPSQVVLRPVRSVAEMTFGAVPAPHKPVDLDAIRGRFEEETGARIIADLQHQAE